MRGSSVKGAVFIDRPPPSLSSVLKNNPLYGDVSLEEAMEERKKNPSWTIEEYDKRSLHTNLSGHLKVLRAKSQSFVWRGKSVKYPKQHGYYGDGHSTLGTESPGSHGSLWLPLFSPLFVFIYLSFTTNLMWHRNKVYLEGKSFLNISFPNYVFPWLCDHLCSWILMNLLFNMY